jgi:hypothetical protein
MIEKGNIDIGILNKNVDIFDSHADILYGADETGTGILSGFETLSSDDIKMSRFRKRYIVKYIIPVNLLDELINDCRENYKLLERCGNLQPDIFLEYFDTVGLNFFNDHVNGKLNRIKVRMRSCFKTGNRIWEIWRRKSKGRMVKKRVPINGSNIEFEEKAGGMVTFYAGIDLHSLSPSLLARFKRITLLNPENKERITIDTGLSFASPGHSEKPIAVPGLAIIEIRKSRRAVSKMVEILDRNNFRPSKISKYCLGITLTNRDAKTNSYKPIIRNIEKTISYGLVE